MRLAVANSPLHIAILHDWNPQHGRPHKLSEVSFWSVPTFDDTVRKILVPS